MSTDFKRISRTAISALGATSLLAASLAVTPPSIAQAEENVTTPSTLAEANAQIDGTISSMNQQAASLQGQIGETNAEITKLETEQAALNEKLKQKKALLRQTVRDAYVAGEPSSVEVVASNQSFSGVVGQQHYRDQVSEKTGKAAEEVQKTEDEIDKKVDDAKKKRDGLSAMKGQLDGKIAAAKAQEEAKAALAQQTLNDERLYQEVKRQEQANRLAAAVTPRAPQNNGGGGGGGGFSYGGGGGAAGLSGSIGYARAGGNCVNEPGVNNPRNGNPISWPVTSSSPRIGATALWTYNHTGVVTGIWSDGSIEVRHQNYGSPGTGWGKSRFPRSAFRGFR